MDTEEILNLARDVVTAWDWTSDVSRPWPTRLDVRVTSMAELVPVVVGLRVKRLGYLAAIVGLDPSTGSGQRLGPAANELEVLYHFCKGAAVITLRVRLPREGATLPTLSDIIPGADVFERELSEMLGIGIRGLYAPAHLCLPDDWPGDVFPLRKDVPLQSLPASNNACASFHFTVDEGTVTGAHIRLDDNRWRVEKVAENSGNASSLPISTACPQAHALAYCLALEQLHGVEAPPRAGSIRVVAAELERIHSHFRWLAETAREAGFESLFAGARQDAETAWSLLETLGGEPVSIPGGVRCDLRPSVKDTLHKGLAGLKDRARHSLDVASNDAIFQQHARNIGVMTRAQAEVLGVVGPAVRASGVMRDIRAEAPYAAYLETPVSVSLETNGDLEARFKVRICELFESIDLVCQMLETMPGGELRASLPENIPAGEAVARVEAPGGELLYFVKSNDGPTLDRVKVCAPGLRNLAAAMRLTVGHPLTEAPVILSGVDAGCPCGDRVVQLRNVVEGWERSLRWDELR